MLTRAEEGTRAQANGQDLFIEMPQTTIQPQPRTDKRRRPDSVLIRCRSPLYREQRLLDDKLETTSPLPVTAPPIR